MWIAGKDCYQSGADKAKACLGEVVPYVKEFSTPRTELGILHSKKVTKVIAPGPLP